MADNSGLPYKSSRLTRRVSGGRGECVSDSNLFSVFGRMAALPGHRDEVIALIKESALAAGSDSGLLTYTINTALDDPDALWVTELWIDQEAHDTATGSEAVAEVTQRFLDLLAEQPAGFYGHAVHVQGRASDSSL
ncbi:putative quinol monooxygenase [Nocardia sp. BMG111209]|uniref:putative quinol monooxygenase n=1 Tax=Nocardia sp. BMG111209 TaxID=1160137 RepID=UPI001E61A42E|nr:antibiotic biosynthesis monooxygenase [Nocardia sp. BMG111209]